MTAQPRSFADALGERIPSLKSRCVIRDDIYYQEVLDLTIWQSGAAFGMLRYASAHVMYRPPDYELAEQFFTWLREGDYGSLGSGWKFAFGAPTSFPANNHACANPANSPSSSQLKSCLPHTIFASTICSVQRVASLSAAEPFLLYNRNNPPDCACASELYSIYQSSTSSLHATFCHPTITAHFSS